MVFVSVRFEFFKINFFLTIPVETVVLVVVVIVVVVSLGGEV